MEYHTSARALDFTRALDFRREKGTTYFGMGPHTSTDQLCNKGRTGAARCSGSIAFPFLPDTGLTAERKAEVEGRGLGIDEVPGLADEHHTPLQPHMFMQMNRKIWSW